MGNEVARRDREEKDRAQVAERRWTDSKEDRESDRQKKKESQSCQ